MSALRLWGAATLLAASPAAAQVSPERLSADVKTLASDAFEGRAPGTPGETKTIAWLIAQFKAMKAQPGGPNGSWFVQVPFRRATLAGTPSIQLTINGRKVQLAPGKDAAIRPNVYASSTTGVKKSVVRTSP